MMRSATGPVSGALWRTWRIARYIGLRSTSRFSQLFTRATGLAPRQFRHGFKEIG
jgi:methylphosphotriester-DNA--protein-cysteine methyltransferase